MEEIDTAVRARATDPETSHRGGQDVQIRAGSQQAILLRSYFVRTEGLTATEAATEAGVSLLSCYWKRCSELRQGGFIRPLLDDDGAPVTRVNPHSGSHQEVNVITSKGRSWIAVSSDSRQWRTA
jgi:hypothetical protein